MIITKIIKNHTKKATWNSLSNRGFITTHDKGLPMKVTSDNNESKS